MHRPQMSMRNLQHAARKAVLPLALLAVVLSGAAVRAPGPTAAAPLDAQQPPGTAPTTAPRITLVYDDAAIRPENRAIVRLLRESGAFQRLVDWTNSVVVSPFPLEIRVTDTLPYGVDDPSTELDGRTIYYPAFWLNMTRDVLAEYVADALREGRRPSMIPPEKFNADDLTIWANQFILGHELGHALIHQIPVPVTGLEEESADGFALFSTLNSADGTAPALGAAILFDEMARREGVLTLEAFASDHAVTQQRTYNFLCYVVGSDPQRLSHPLVVEGYLPELRAMFCPLAWTQLSYGWWTVLEPHFAPGYQAAGAQARAQARQQLGTEERAVHEQLRQPPTPQ